MTPFHYLATPLNYIDEYSLNPQDSHRISNTVSTLIVNQLMRCWTVDEGPHQASSSPGICSPFSIAARWAWAT